ncbi:DUF2975 domain-containing protein [Devosia sp. XK-2]|uniref:DUF2975 domain-containing protein n=1 Tax=Devosia sp. XK-2 TaxID=3126689 RepID=UPI0030CDBCE1
MIEVMSTPPAALPSQREKRFFLTLAVIAGIIAALLPIGLIGFWAGIVPDDLWGRAVPGLPVGLELDLGKRAGAAILGLIPMGLLVWGLLRVRQTFIAFAAGEVFSASAIAGLRDFAIGVGASALIQPLIGALLSLYLTWDAPAGGRRLVLQLGSDTALFVLFAATFLAATWTMRRAAALAEENSQFV